MSAPHDDFIDGLVGELKPKPKWLRPISVGLIWWLASWVFVFGAILTRAPLRPGFDGQLVESLRLALEVGIGLGLGAAGISAALRLAVPDPTPLGQRLVIPAVLLASWLGLLAYGLSDPALAPSMLGKREGCWIEALLYGLPPLALGLALLRRLAPLSRAPVGALLGLTAGSLPGILMQLACMYDPWHALTHHVGPMIPLALLGAVLGPRILRRI